MSEQRPKTVRRPGGRRPAPETPAPQPADAPGPTPPRRPRGGAPPRPRPDPAAAAEREASLRAIAEMDREAMREALEASRPRRHRRGDRVTGTVAAVDGERLLVDVGERLEAVLDGASPGPVEVGRRVEGYVVGRRGGRLLLAPAPPPPQAVPAREEHRDAPARRPEPDAPPRRPGALATLGDLMGNLGPGWWSRRD